MDLVAFTNLAVVTENHDTDVIFLKVQREAEDAAGELHELARHNVREAMDAGDAIAGVDDGSDVRGGYLRAELLDLLLEDGCDFVCSYCHALPPCS